MNGQVNVVTTDKEGVFDSTFLEDMMLSEITQIQKDKSFHDLVCMWNLRGKSNSRKQRVKCWPPGPEVGEGVGPRSQGLSYVG